MLFFDATIVFSSKDVFGDLSFFFFDNLIDIASDVSEVRHLRGHEGRFGGDWLRDASDRFSFFEKISKFAIRRSSSNRRFEILGENRKGFDGGLTIEPNEILPVLAWWIENRSG